MRDLKDLSFGWLTVQRLAEPQTGHTCWHVVCRCGVEKDVRQDALISGRVVSCGCRKQDPEVQSRRILNSVPQATRERVARDAAKARWKR